MMVLTPRPDNAAHGIWLMAGAFFFAAVTGLYLSPHSFMALPLLAIALLLFAAHGTGLELRRACVASAAMLLTGVAVWVFRQGFLAMDLMVGLVASVLAVASYRYAPTPQGMAVALGSAQGHTSSPTPRPQRPATSHNPAPTTPANHPGQRGSGENPNSGLILDADLVAPRYSFQTLAGMATLKKQLLEAGKAALERGNPAQMEVRNGILLTGEPGNGKTVFAEALADELKARFLPISMGQIDGPYIGTRTTLIRNAFARAQAYAPCVLFLDEVESMIPDRNAKTAGLSTHQETLNMVNELLQLISKVRGSGVVLVAATNHPDKLDPAAVRPGRFDFKIEVPDPDWEARMMIAASVFQPAQTARSCQFDHQSLRDVLVRWDGYSAATVRAAAVQALTTARSDGTHRVGGAELKAALRTTQTLVNHLPPQTKALKEMVLASRIRKSLTGLAQRMQRTEELERAGGSLPTGVLFYGPPGTGKTEAARALAKETGWQFLPVVGADLVRDPDRLDDVMRKARNLRPCIVFIDEAEDLLRDRANSDATAATTKLLANMDGAKGRLRDLLFIAATNYPGGLDPAMMRGGRFSEKIEFELATPEQVTDYMATMLSRRGWRTHGFGVAEFAEYLDGVALADVEAVLQAAINHALARDSMMKVRVITREDLEVAVEGFDG